MTVNAKIAREQFSSLMESVARGNTITITRRGKPIARLSPIAQPGKTALPDLSEFHKTLKRAGGPETTIEDLRRMDRY